MVAKHLRLLGGGFFLVCCGLAEAHTGHGTSGFVTGLLHPFGIDHLLAMLAVGVWSVSVLPAKRVGWGPAIFMVALVLGAAAGMAGFSLPYLEALIAISVLVFGSMLVITRSKLPLSVGLIAIALGASWHGLAHGAEAPEVGFAVYASGFLISTAILHLIGVILGQAVRMHCKNLAPVVLQMLGVGCGTAGLFFLSQI
jgi:urease accessory protein